MSPDARSETAMVYDAATQQVVLFGGSGDGPALNDTWTWDGTTWTLQRPPQSPPARDGLGMAYDTTTQKVVVFGGCTRFCVQFLGDTWTWDGTNWTKEYPASSPPSEHQMGMTYDDARSRVVLFGGSNSSGLLGDTWTWDGTTWTQESPPTSPPARDYIADDMVFDAARSQVVLFGGSGASGLLNDTWTWDGTTWTQQTPVDSPPPGFGIPMAYDATGQEIVLYGPPYFTDTWTWDGTTWTRAQTLGTWTPTGSMSFGRAIFTATLLANGKVLVAGGCTDLASFCHDGTASAELYDPGTGIWTPTGSMTTRRTRHTATLLSNGQVLVSGGENSDEGALSSAELYDPNTGVWTSTGSMLGPRSAHVATVFTSGPMSGMVLVAGGSSVCGGCTPVLATAELYDPNTGVWSATASMTRERMFGNLSSTELSDGSVVVVGGNTCCPYHWFTDAELYDPVTQTWTQMAKTTNAEELPILLQDGKLLVAGGTKGTQPTAVNVADAELFDSSSGIWTPTASMSTDRAGHTLTLLPSGQALVAGGSSGGWGVCNDVTSSELYDSSNGTWILTGEMTTARSNFTATLLPNGQVLAAGGSDCEGNLLSSAELYTPPPIATLSTANLTFSLQLVGTRSAAQTATLTNSGSTTLSISSIGASGDFESVDNCGSSLPAGESCTIRVAFSPTDKGVRSGTVTITDDAANSPQTIALTGTGTVVKLSPTSLHFPRQRVGTISPPQTVTLTNTGSTSLNIQGIGISGDNFGDFIETTTCGSSVPANSSCAINIRFKPTAIGERTASVKVRHDGGGAQPVNLTGTGR
jgi:hypothetical protein